MHILLLLCAWIIGLMLLGAILCHLIPRLGPPGRALGSAMTRAPGIDIVLGYFLIGPWIAGPIVAGWAGLGVAVVSQYIALLIWIAAHELAMFRSRPPARIHATLSRLVGGWRNHLAVWITSFAVPLFWLVRLAQYLVYPLLIWTIHLPRYKHADWVNISRHKFRGLIGYDLIWCLYCDWMTGVWSLGGEMLRNVESFWCPIRFYSENKCDNCINDFPDINNGWVAADGDMTQVTDLLTEKYADTHERTWFSHPARLTIKGKTPDGE